MLRVQVRGLLVLQLGPVRARARVQVPVREQVRGLKHHHNLGRQWPGSRRSFSSIGQLSSSKLHRRRCANC